MKYVEDQGRDNLNAALHKEKVEAGAPDINPQEDGPDSVALAALGGEYIIGDLTLSVTPGRVSLLEMIDSPFLGSEEGDEHDKIAFKLSDVVRALYVLGKGPEAIEPIMRVKARIKSLATMEKMAEKRPEFFEKFLDKKMEIEGESAAFDIEAWKFYEEFCTNTWDLDEQGSFIINILNDAFSPMEMMPPPDMKGEEPGSKKN